MRYSTLIAASLLVLVTACVRPVARVHDGDSRRPTRGVVDAQGTVNENVVSYVELLGAGIFLGSINVEYPFTPSLALRAGASPIGVFPIMARYMTSGSPHRLEAGAGVLVSGGDVDFAALSLGYRYQPAGRGVVLRATLYPLLFWPGLSFGYAF
jgi:hypothetical protein